MALQEEEIRQLSIEHNVKSPYDVERYCLHCGKQLELTQWEHVKRKKYCSKKCMHDYLGYAKEIKFPAIKMFETKQQYAKRCLNNESVARAYPNRKIRRKMLEEYHKSVPYKQRHAKLPPGKHLFYNDAAAYLGVAGNTLMYWERRGYIKPGRIKYKGKMYRVYEIAVLKEIKRVRDEAFRKKQESNSNKMDPDSN